MKSRVVSALALAAGLSVAFSGLVVAADDYREVWDNKTDVITQAIDNSNWQKATDKSVEWLGQLGAWDGTYPADIDDTNCYREYDALYTISGAAAVGGKAHGDTKGAPGLVGAVLHAAAVADQNATREAVDVCVADGGPALDVDPTQAPAG